VSSNDIIYQSKGALVAFLVSEGFQTGSDTGNITGSALDNEIAVWSNPTTIEGSSNLTFDGTDLGVSAKIFHVGDTDTYINFTDDDINIQAGGVNFLDFTQDTQNDVTFNEGGVDIDFRVETADESHMLFIEGSSNRMSIGDNTGSPGATLEVKNNASAGAYGVPLVQLNSNDTDQQCLDINADNITANVVNITANDVTTARVLAIGADGLTTGNAFYVDDNSSDTGTRNTALIIQNNAAAIAATALAVQSDGGVTGVKIDKNYSDTAEASIVGLDIDFDKTATTTSDNTMYGIQLDMDNTTATNGSNTMYGLHVTPTLTHAADAGTPIVYGALINAQGGTNGTSGLVQAARFEAGGGDLNYGIQLDVEDGGVDLRIESSADNGDYFQIQTTTAGATTITTVDDNASAADLTFTVDGDISLDALAGAGTTAITSDLTIGGDVTLTGGGFVSALCASISGTDRSLTDEWVKVAEYSSTGLNNYATAVIDVVLAGHDGTSEIYQARVHLRAGSAAYGYSLCQVDIIQDAGSEAWDTSDFILTQKTTSTYEGELWVRAPTTNQQCYATITNGTITGQSIYKIDWVLTPGQTWGSFASAGQDITTTNVKKRFDSLVIDGDLTVTGNDIKGSGGTAITMDGSNNVTIAGDLTVTGNDIKGSGGTAITMDGSNNVTIAGDLTVSGQPAVCAVLTSNQAIGSSLTKIIFDSVTAPGTPSPGSLFDVGGDYDTSTGIFTAPADGKYLISASSLIQGAVVSNVTYMSCVTTKSTAGTDYFQANYYGSAVLAADGYVPLQGTWLVSMDQNDQAYINVECSAGTGATYAFGHVNYWHTRLNIIKVA